MHPKPGAASAATRQHLRSTWPRRSPPPWPLTASGPPRSRKFAPLAGMEPEQVRALIASGATVDSARKAARPSQGQLSAHRFRCRSHRSAPRPRQVPLGALGWDAHALRYQLDKPADGPRFPRHAPGWTSSANRWSCPVSAPAAWTRAPWPVAPWRRHHQAIFPQPAQAGWSTIADRRLQRRPRPPWRPMVAVSDATDFKTKHAIKLSGSPDLLALNENGEYRTADLSESVRDLCSRHPWPDSSASPGR